MGDDEIIVQDKPKDNVSKIYEYLKQNNVVVPDDEEIFRKSLQNKENSDKIHSFLKSKEVVVPDSQEEFYTSLKKKELADQDQETGSNGSPEPGKPSSKSTIITDQQRKDISKIKFEPHKYPEIAQFEREKKKADEQALIEFATGDKEKPNEFFQIANDPKAAIDQSIKSFNKAIIQSAASIPKSVAIIAKPIDKFFGINTEKPIQEYATYKAGQWLEDKAIQWGITATDPERDQSFWQSTIPNALGSVAAIALTGGKPSGNLLEGAALTQKEAIMKGLQETGQSLTSPGSIVGSTSMAVPEFEAAKRAGATDDEAFKVWAKNYFVGTTEILPIERGLERINKLSGGKLIDIVKAGVPQAIEEGTQETVQQILQNKIAQGSYDPERDTFTDVLQSGGAGFFVGFILPGIGAAMQHMTPEQQQKTKAIINTQFKNLATGDTGLTTEQKAQPTDEVIQDQTKAVDKTDVASIEAASKVIQEKVDQNNQQENASTILQDQGAVPQGGQAVEGSQENRGNDVQQNQEPQQKVNAEVEQQGGLKNPQVPNEKLVENSNLPNNGNEIPESVPQGERGTENEKNGGVEQTSTAIEGSLQNAIRDAQEAGRTLSREEQITNQDRSAEKLSKDNGTWIPIDQVKELGEPLPSGNENETFLKEGQVYKVNNFTNNQGSILTFLDYIKNHNSIFPSSKYELVGFTGRDNGTVYPVTKQQYVDSDQHATPKEIDDYMGKLGFNKISDGSFTNGKITVSDLHPRNVLKDKSGDVFVIDDIIKQNNNKNPKELKIAQRIMESDANEAIKKGLQEKGIEYIPKGIEVTDKEAKDLIELYGHDKAETIVRDTKNNITADTRTALAARLYESYKDQADKATDPVVKQQLYNKAVDVALFGAEQAKESGRAVNAAKIWKSITSDEDMMVMAFEQHNKNVAKSLVQPIQGKVTKSKQEFDEEIRKIIAQKVTEGVESRLAKAKLITKEKRAEISNFFDSLKVKDVKGTANDITRVLGASVWNGSIEAVKRAVLTGADVANAIQAGIDYIKENYKGSDFNEEDYKNMITPHVEKLTKNDIKLEQIDVDKIHTPKISGKKKKDFISQVVHAYNNGELTSDKFEELYAKQIGYKEYTDAEREQIRALSKVISEAEKFTKEVQDNFTRENIDKYNDLLKKAQIANKKMQEFARKPNDIFDTLITIMQGNLLTPLSLVTNVYSNLLLQPLRFTSTAVGSVLDTGLSQVAKTGLLSESFKDKTIDLVALQKGFFPAGWNGTMEGLRQLKTGSLADERELREIQSAFNPLKAIERWADGNRTVQQKANDYIEGTFGIPAEVMFRLLNLGDKPFKKAAENARAVELGTLQGLKGNDLLKFIMFPDEKSQEQITKAGREATFQQETVFSKGIQKGITWLLNYVAKAPYVGGVAKVILKSQVPYVKTPLNIVAESFDYAIPPWSLAKGIISYAKGDKRSGNISVSKAIVGAMIISAAKMLFQLGLLSPDEDDEKKGKPKSARNLQYETVPPNSINISALNRILTGGGSEIKDNDIWVNYKKMGITGIILDIHANQSFKQLKETGHVDTGWNELANDIFTGAPSTISSALDQSFLKGTNSFLNALQDAGGYEAQQWAIETTGALSSIVYPNTVATISKSADEYVRDTNDKDFLTKLQNTYKTKLFIGDQLPPKVNLWGEKITGNPEGRDKFVYYLFDPTKFKSVDTDNYKYKLYNEWKNDAYNDDWLPNIPSRNLAVKGVNIPLTGPEYAKFCQYAGKERAILTQAYINSLGFEATKKEKKLERLEKLYNKSREIGKRKFLIDTGWNVLTKEKLEKLNK